MGDLWTSPFFISAVAVTIVFTVYAFFYLPRQMHKAYRQSLLTLARAVETKDTGAEGHGERVSENMVAVAREMHLKAPEMQKMEYAAFLQDIGNVRVPHAILNKAGALDDDEFETLKNHTTIGAEMVEQVKFLKEVAPIIRHHHEAWDGTGYPDGLKRDQIPLGSRILAVCTAFDSMTHDRAFRGKMSDETALREIGGSAGTKYDPAVVYVFLKLMKEKLQREGRLS